jgi:AAA15 family ATPase/GTPase
MIKYFAVENFRSIKSENILEFDTGLSPNTTFVSNPVIGFAGANASGKTTILNAITFLLWFMKDSFLNIGEDQAIPVVPFAVASDSPVRFHIIFSKKTRLDDSERYVDYEYELSLTRKEVLYESLSYYPYGRKRTAYIRDDKQIEFGHSISLPVHDTDIFKRNLRDNSSVIAYAAQYPSQKIAIECQHYNFQSNAVYFRMKEADFQPWRELLENEEDRNNILEFIKIADIGIENIIRKKLELEMLFKIFSKETAINLLPKDMKEKILKDGEEVTQVTQLFFEHNLDNRRIRFNESQESSGTLQFLTILSQVLRSLKQGTLLILDEIEVKLHQDLVAYIIGLYNNEHYNTNNAQVIFSFHNTSFMKILTPEQLWFTEKNDSGHTEIFSASHFEDIKNLHERNLEKLYRIGRFGAKPRGI